MEMESLFFGESENAFFNYNDLEKARKIVMPLYPLPYYNMLGDPKIKYTPKQNGEIRLLAMDVATAGGSRNDNSCITLLQMVPIGNCQFVRNILYMETMNGGHTFTQSIRLRQLFDDLDADYVVVDAVGVGNGIIDNLTREQYDEDRDITYPSWSCINDENIARNSQNPSQNKLIYAVRATQQSNSDMAAMLRDGLKRGKIRLITDESVADEMYKNNKNFNVLSQEEQMLIRMPYYQITLFIYETINLSYRIVNNKIKVEESSSMRKDRYSSVCYANYIAAEIEREIRPRQSRDMSSISSFASKPQTRGWSFARNNTGRRR